MDLKTYLKSRRGNGALLAEALAIPPSLIYQWSSGVRQVPAERCPAIERATEGAIRCEELRSDIDWACLRGTDCCGQKEAA